MSRMGSKDTKPELMIRKAMWAAGLRGYRLHWKKAPGKPDIAFPGKKKALFIHGCYWHRCPSCNLPTPKNNADFWTSKFNRNKERDAENLDKLSAQGWSSLVLWECQVKSDIVHCMDLIRIFLAK